MAFQWLRGSADGGVLRAQAFGDDPNVKLRVRWGDGTGQLLGYNVDTDGDGVNDTLEVGHGYASDGIYKVVVDDVGIGTVALFGDAGSAQLLNTGSFSGNDLVDGSRFDDKVLTSEGADLIYGGDGDDILNSGTQDNFGDRVFGGAGNDHILAYSAEFVSDELFGEDGNDVILSDGGNGLLDGGSGNDILSGGSDSDTLIGGLGSDRLYGNSIRSIGMNARELAADLFVFTPDTISKSDVDTIMDFDSREGDKIDLRGFELPFTFVGSRFTGSPMEVRAYELTSGSHVNTIVSLDVDGDRVSDMTIVLRDVTGVSSSDFVF